MWTKERRDKFEQQILPCKMRAKMTPNTKRPIDSASCKFLLFPKLKTIRSKIPILKSTEDIQMETAEVRKYLPLSLSLKKKGGGGRGERRKASRLVTRAAATCDFEWKLLLRG